MHLKLCRNSLHSHHIESLLCFRTTMLFIHYCSSTSISLLHPDQSPYLPLAGRLNGAHLFGSQLIQPPASHSRFARWVLCSCQTLQHSTLDWFNPACFWPACPGKLPVLFLPFDQVSACYHSPEFFMSFDIFISEDYQPVDLNWNCFLRTQGLLLNAASGSSFCPWQYLLPSQM